MANHGSTIKNMPSKARMGLAFSGGGIRSAALCSGVLRRLLHRGVQADYVSCVSGGNYTAASYVDWKYRNGNYDNPKWHKDFFEHMRSRVAYICNWRDGCMGLLECLLLIILVLFVNILIPFSIWGSFSIPIAYVVDFIFGDMMRAGFKCGQFTPGEKTLTSCGGKFNRNDPDIHKPITLFAFLIISFVVLQIVKWLVAVSQRFKGSAMLSIFSGLILVMVFPPWIIQQFFDVTPIYLNIIIIVLSISFWLGFPLLRDKASLALIFYFYAFVTRWRVYKGLFVVDYTEHTFFVLLRLAGFVIWASPFLGMFSNTAVFTFYKWRLQRAFFHKHSSGACGCQGITCQDFFPISSALCPCAPARKSVKVLTMADISDVKPHYISNVTIDHWRKSPEMPPYGIMSISATRVERIDRQPGERGFQLGPERFKVADAMTISASIMARSKEHEESFRDLQMILGLAIRKHVRSDPTEDNTKCGATTILPVLLQSIVAFPLVFLALISHEGRDTRLAEVYIIYLIVAYIVFFTAIAVLPTGSKSTGLFNACVWWCHVHLYHVRFLREFLKVANTGPTPPALLALSDAGRLEKYGLIPLLKLKLPKILIVDGSLIRDDKDRAKHLFNSLAIARKELHCEFVGYGGRDVMEEIEKKYVRVDPGNQPRSYRFLVRYFRDEPDSPGRYVEVGRGEILLVSPRHPDNGMKFPTELDPTWAQFTRDTGEELDERVWGPGFVLQADDVDRLTFCCCECCHSRSSFIQKVSRTLCMGFPRHSTVNQFFTSSYFTAYHREGYRACVEAGVEEFLNDSTSVTITAEPLICSDTKKL